MSIATADALTGLAKSWEDDAKTHQRYDPTDPKADRTREGDTSRPRRCWTFSPSAHGIRTHNSAPSARESTRELTRRLPAPLPLRGLR